MSSYYEYLSDHHGLSSGQIEYIRSYIKELMIVNEHTNLTGAKTEADFLEKHVVDSVEAYRVYQNEYKPSTLVWDIGSGGGLPGAVLAILRPETKVVCIERRQKKANFLSEIVEKAGLKGQITVKSEPFEALKPIPKHAELWFRGFLPGDKLIEYFSANFKSAELGQIILMKGPSWEQELAKALDKKNLRSEWIERFQQSTAHKYDLPNNIGSRNLVIL